MTAPQHFRTLCEEMLAWVEGKPARRCFEGIEWLVGQAIPAALSAGIYRWPFDFNIVDRDAPGDMLGYFTDWPKLDTLEFVQFRGPDNAPPATIILDARDKAGRRIAALASRDSWGKSRDRVRVILRRWVDAQAPSGGGAASATAPAEGDAQPAEAKKAQHEAKVKAFSTSNPDGTLADATKATGLKNGQIQRTDAWDRHQNDRIQRRFDEKPDISLKELAKLLGVSEAKVSSMSAWETLQTKRGGARLGRKGIQGDAPATGKLASDKEELLHHLLEYLKTEYQQRLEELGDPDEINEQKRMGVKYRQRLKALTEDPDGWSLLVNELDQSKAKERGAVVLFIESWLDAYAETHHKKNFRK